MPITLPAKPDAAVQPAPRIGSLLGAGSLVIVRRGSIEIKDPAYNTVAKGTIEAARFADRPWSPNGQALVYSNQDVLRALDFAAGEDRFVARAPSGYLLITRFYWIENGSKIIFQMQKVEQLSAWIVAVDGSGLEQFALQHADPRDAGFNANIFITDVSRDGWEVLVRAEEADGPWAYRSAVFLVDMKTMRAQRVSPNGCVIGKFTDNETQILYECLRDVPAGTLPVDIYVSNRDGSNPLKLVEGEIGRVGPFAAGASSDGRWLAFMEHYMPNEPASRNMLYLLDRVNDTKKMLMEVDTGKMLKPLGFTADNKFFLTILYNRNSDEGSLLRVNLLTGKVEVMEEAVIMAAFSTG